MRSIVKKFKNLRKKVKSKNNKEKKRQKREKNNNTSDLFLNKYNQKVLKRYNKPVITKLRERKNVFIEVKEIINNIPSKSFENGDSDD